METTEKKPKNGFDRLKVKYAKLKAEKEELEKKLADKPNYKGLWEEEMSKYEQLASKHKQLRIECGEKDETIRKQGTKISTLTADLANAQGEAREYRNKFEEAVRRMGGFRRFIYGYNIPQFTDEDRWHD